MVMWIDLSQLKAFKHFSSIFDDIYNIPISSHDIYGNPMLPTWLLCERYIKYKRLLRGAHKVTSEVVTSVQHSMYV